MYSSTLSLTSALAGVGGQRHAPAALPPGKRHGTRCIGGCRLEKTNTKFCTISCRFESDFGPGRAESLSILTGNRAEEEGETV